MESKLVIAIDIFAYNVANDIMNYEPRPMQKCWHRDDWLK